MFETLATGIWIGAAALFGLLIGSFLNVCIYRLPAGLTIVRGHSFCPQCKHPLGSLDLVPVFSYLLLGRRCRYCHEPISPRYARIELLTCAYFTLTALAVRPGETGWPEWLRSLLPGSAGAQPDGVFSASLLLAIFIVLVFSGFLVWAMILWDGQTAPNGLLLFIAVPVSLHLALRPEKLVSSLLAAALALLVHLLLTWLRLYPEMPARQRLQTGASLGLLGLAAGLPAVQPVLAVLLIELLFLSLYGQKSAATGRADQLWRSLPLQLILIGSVARLFF
ncbi:MAG TPA: hypothetical protein DD640_01855 [Clostridiales bacterium]|nr:hypothetical protein [Clostridiales bacterium]